MDPQRPLARTPFQRERAQAYFLVNGPQDAQLAEADVEGRAGQLDSSVRRGSLNDDHVDGPGERGGVDVLVVLYSLLPRSSARAQRARRTQGGLRSGSAGRTLATHCIVVRGVAWLAAGRSCGVTVLRGLWCRESRVRRDEGANQLGSCKYHSSSTSSLKRGIHAIRPQTTIQAGTKSLVGVRLFPDAHG